MQAVTDMAPPNPPPRSRPYVRTWIGIPAWYYLYMFRFLISKSGPSENPFSSILSKNDVGGPVLKSEIKIKNRRKPINISGYILGDYPDFVPIGGAA